MGVDPTKFGRKWTPLIRCKIGTKERDGVGSPPSNLIPEFGPVADGFDKEFQQDCHCCVNIVGGWNC